MTPAREVLLDDIDSPPPHCPLLALTYSSLLGRGYKFPPVLLERRDGRLSVVDGHHRVAAYRLAQRLTIWAFIH